MRHAFVIPAYRESPYLRACIESLLAQDVASEVHITTSTPSRFLSDLAHEYGLRLIVNDAAPAIASDWNFALRSCDADLVTLAHQDDIFLAGYSAAIVDAFSAHPEAVMAFTGHLEHTPMGVRPTHLNLRIKRLICRRAFAGRRWIGDAASMRRLLCWGNPIACPGVAINRRIVPDFSFSEAFEINLDWDAWQRLGAHAGGVLHLPQALVSHRIHGGTETTASIADRRREREDLTMFLRFWPPVIARAILCAYRLSYLGNALVPERPRGMVRALTGARR